MNPFLQTVLPRVQSAVQRLEKSIWVPLEELECEALSASECRLTFAQASERKPEKVKLPLHWGKLYDDRWFRVEVPAGRGDRVRYLTWRGQGQTLSYLDGVPYYGFDPAHHYCPIPAEGGEFWLNNVVVRPFICHPDNGLDEAGCRVDGAFLLTRSDEHWNAYHDLKILFDLAFEELKNAQKQDGVPYKLFGNQRPLDLIPPVLRRLLRSLDEAVSVFDKQGVRALCAFLREIYQSLSGSIQPVSCRLIGHAHIDLVWLWPECVGQKKTVHSFATVNRIMDTYPELRFTHSQTAAYKAVEQISPELHRQVCDRIREGKWEATGALEVESDTLLACGEALLRSFWFGQQEFKRIRGIPAKTVWLPDVFGYAACLPQLMNEFGVESFFTTKLTWSAINRFPYSSFIWKGHDSSAVVAHVTQEIGYNGTIDLRELRLGAEAYCQADVHDQFIAPTGHGDGGGGPTEAMCERARRLRDLAGVPNTEWDTVENFFKRLAAVKEKLPIYQGELYLEYHRGTFTTHHDLKLNFRRAERALQVLEAVHCAQGLGEISQELWERMVFAQFHDYIPGSSVPDVYRQANPELLELRKRGLDLASERLNHAGAQPCLFNPLAHALAVYSEERRSWIEVPGIAGIPLAEARALEFSAVEASIDSLKNARVEAHFSSSGGLVSLVVDGKRVELQEESCLMLYPDVPHLFDAWEIDRQTLDQGEGLTTETIACVEVSDERYEAAVVFTRSLGSASKIVTRYHLRASESVLRVAFDIDWQEPEHLLKLAIPTGYRSGMARFGAPFGSVTRSQLHNGSVAEAQWEVPASRWAVVSDEDGTGLFVVTEAKYGFSCREGALTVSLVRSPLITGCDAMHSSIYPENLLRTEVEHRHTDIGTKVIHLAIGLHHAQMRQSERPAALADVLFAEVLRYQGASVSAGFLRLENAHSLQPAWAKPAADGEAWILRLHETEGARGVAEVRLRPGWEAIRVNAQEQEAERSPTASIHFTPYELISLKIQRTGCP